MNSRTAAAFARSLPRETPLAAELHQGRWLEPRRGPRFEEYYARRGTGRADFGTRLQRARLLFLRRRELAGNWLALGVLIGCWHAEALWLGMG